MVAVHLESAEDVVILEGEANQMMKVDSILAGRLAEASNAKYADAGHRTTAKDWEGDGLYAIRPRVVIAWSKFPRDATRWTLAQ
jgi:hypothetical protein